MPESVELRMKCPVCGVRNHSVTFQHNGPTLYHDCGHTSADLMPKAVPHQQSNTLLGVPRPTDPMDMVMGYWPDPCPECMQGKHANCDGFTWDERADAPTACPCEKRGHQ